MAHTTKTLWALSWVLLQRATKEKKYCIPSPTLRSPHAISSLHKFISTNLFKSQEILASPKSWWRWISNGKTGQLGRQRGMVFTKTPRKAPHHSLWGQQEDKYIKGNKCSDMESSRAELGFYAQWLEKVTQSPSHIQHTVLQCQWNDSEEQGLRS